MEPEPGPAEKDKQTLSTPPRDITQKDPGWRFFKWGVPSLNLTGHLFHTRDTFIPLWGVEGPDICRSQGQPPAGSADLHRLNALDSAGERGFQGGRPAPPPPTR
jgi:hypothetical protein